MIQAIVIILTLAHLHAIETEVLHYKINHFLSEKLCFRVKVLMFFNVGRIEISMEKGPSSGEYVAIMKAEASSVIKFLTSFKRLELKSRMKLDEEEGHLQTIAFSEEWLKGHKHTYTRFRCDNRMMYIEKGGEGLPLKRRAKTLPDGSWCSDPLSAMYNFRAGAYGKITPGDSYPVRAFPLSQRNPLMLEILEGGSMRKRLKKVGNSYYVGRVRIDGRIFGVKASEIYLWGDKNLLPVKGVIVDAYLYGDITAKLQNNCK